MANHDVPKEVRDAETGELLALCPLVAAAFPATPPRGLRSERNAETQSTRKLGDGVAWQHVQSERVERADRRQRHSLEGVRQELRRRDLSDIVRRRLEAELLDRTKVQYAAQVQRMVEEEVERERARELELSLEPSAVARQRLRKHHDAARAFYKQQLERVRGECELALTSAMAQRNLLR